MAVHEFRGVIPPLLLPLTDQSEIDEESLERQALYLLRSGVQGFWVNGTTGDFFALTDQEMARVIQICARIADGKVPIIAQVGDCATRRVIQKGELARESGAAALAVVLPYYLDYSQEELKDHYRIISRALDSSLFLYQLPQMCKVALSIPSILELAQEGVLVGIKDSAGSIDFYYTLIRRVKTLGVNLRCFYGASSLADVSLYVGGHGLMCAIANLVPHLCCELFLQASAGRWEEARRVNQRILAVADAVKLPTRQNWAATVAAYKRILKELGVIASARVFAPLQPLTKEEKQYLAQGALPLVAREMREED